MTIYRGYNLISYKDFTPSKSELLTNTKSKKKPCVFSDYICLDTETSHNHNEQEPTGWVYQWSFTYQDNIVYGRTPTQLVSAITKIVDVNNADMHKQIIIFVHNLPYDFCYLQQYFDSAFGGVSSVLAYAPHKLFKITYNNGVDLRCTYKLSNKSLYKWSKDLNTTHKKLVGAIDYDIIRYQDTPLYRDDWRYMFYDVIVLNECVNAQMRQYNDTLLTMPLTSTGYVRREIRNEYKKDNDNFKQFQRASLSVNAYKMYRTEFCGGISHGNRFLTSETIKGVIRHRDFRSHYPSQQRVQKFPTGKTFLLWDSSCKRKMTLQRIRELSEQYCLQVELIIYNMELKDNNITMPYAQSSKFKKDYEHGTKFYEDNGRILKMDGMAHVIFNEIDLKWLSKQYNFRYKIISVYACNKDYLPQFMTDIIDIHFKGKSDYKNKVKELKEQKANEIEILDVETNLMKSKNVVNGIYGCSATDPVREDIQLNGIEWIKDTLTSEDIEDKLNKYYKSRNNYNRYEWGTYTTAYARDELMHFIADIIGYDNFLYCDTDSIFYVSTPEIEERIEKENKRLYEKSIKLGAYITTDKGDIITYNAFELEKEDITQFRFLHSKCYAYTTKEYDKEILHSIIAGVVARANGTTREKELGNINNLTNKFVFKKTGGNTCVYIDREKETITIDGHRIETGTSAIIRAVDKTLKCDFDNDLIYFQDI